MGYQPKEKTYRASQNEASSSLVPMSNECRLPGTYIISLDKASHGSSHHIPGFDTTYIDRTQSLRTNTFQRGLLQPGLSVIEDGPQTAPVVSRSSQSPTMYPATVPLGASIFDFSSQNSSLYSFGATDIPGASVYKLNSYNSLASSQSPLPVGASIFNLNSGSICSNHSLDSSQSNQLCHLPGVSLMDLHKNDSHRSQRPTLQPGISLQTTESESFQMVDINGHIMSTTTAWSPDTTPQNTPPVDRNADINGSSGGGIKNNTNNGGDINEVGGFNKNGANGGNNEVVNRSTPTSKGNTLDISTSSNNNKSNNKEVATISNIIVTFRNKSGVMSDVREDANNYDGGGGGSDGRNDGGGKDNGDKNIGDDNDIEDLGGGGDLNDEDAAKNGKHGCADEALNLKDNDINNKTNNEEDSEKEINIGNFESKKNNLKENDNIKESSPNNKNDPNSDTNHRTKADGKIESKRCHLM